ncbi:hypothetical protein QQZ08_007046 [Neonectria magnoliae]|uniref:Uncharacterized protein n=1 Tax=Neonectria magnoliae TaxID=2732573 RepID=A0ABR1I0N3_9HYPO
MEAHDSPARGPRDASQERRSDLAVPAKTPKSQETTPLQTPSSPETLDYRYLAFHRRVQELLDKKINEGTREAARWKLKIEKTLIELERGTDQYAKQERRELLVRANALEYSNKELLDKVTNLEEKVKKLGEKVSRVESKADSDSFATQQMLVRLYPEVSEARRGRPAGQL